MMISKRFTVDLENLGSTPIVHAIQNDGCVRGLEVRLRRGGRPYRIPEDAQVVVRYKKLNGQGAAYDTLADGSPAWSARVDLLTVALAPQMLTMPGSVSVTVSLYQSGALVGLFPVVVYVEGSANPQLPDSGASVSLSGGWPAPAKAVEGQFLRVAAVDGAGNVTALDTAEASSCPDWNQNDPAGADYIKNRPFYEYTHETDTVGWDAYCDSVSIAEGTEDEITLVRLPAEVSLEQLLGGLTLRITLADGTVQEFSDFEGDGAGSTVAEPIDEYATNIMFFDGILGFYISADGYTLTDEDLSLTFPRAGLWLYSYFDYIFPGCRQEFIFRSGPVTATSVCRISGKFIPALPYIHEGERENFATTDDIVGRKVEGGGELFNNASVASGLNSHAEGSGTKATGKCSHAEGTGCHACSADQHVQGKYNLEDSQGKYAHIVGNGTSAARSNAHTIDWEGNAWFAGAIKVGGTGQEDEAAVQIPTKPEVQEMIDAAVEAAGGSGGGVETETVLSDNLFDKSAITTGSIFYHGGAGVSLVASDTGFYTYVPLRGAGTYRTILYVTLYGEDLAKRVPILKEDKTWLQNVEGTLTYIDSGNAYLEFTVTQAMVDNGAALYAFSGCDSTLYTYNSSNLMIVKDREYPTTYIPYGHIEVATDSGRKQDNVLCEKVAVFLGDSICAGTTVGEDSEYYGYGWGGIIGEKNHMTWRNYGKNGGVITPREAVGSGLWICAYADTAAAEYPAADYVIFEGGCNDADQMKEAGLGEISSDYATFDTTTFSGALESLILKILTTWPNARVGYIIPQKMYTGYPDYTAANHIHRLYFERAIEVCRKWGIPYIDLWNGSPLNPKLSTHSLFYVEENGQHLTEAGYLRITPKIEAFMRSL